MENLNYLPTAAFKSEFEEFRKLKTEREREIFLQNRKSEFAKKTPAEQQKYIEASKISIRAISNRVEELIEQLQQKSSFERQVLFCE